MINKKGAIDHLRLHATHPASAEKLKRDCENLSDFSKEDKEWFMAHLPNDTYTSADKVIMALGL